MQITRLFSLFILFTIGLTVPAAKVYAQQDVPAPTRLALEVTFYPGRQPAYETVPGPDSKPSGAWFGFFGRIASWQAPAGASANRGRACYFSGRRRCSTSDRVDTVWQQGFGE
jgi:hypothetical protein